MAMQWTGGLRLHRIAAAAHRGAVEGLQEAADLVLARANVPVESGELRDSGKVSINAGSLSAAVSYDTPYAVAQHEEMSHHHPDGEAKFLENAFNELRPDLLDVIADHIRRRL